MGSSVLAKMAVEISANKTAFSRTLKSADSDLKLFSGGIQKLAGVAAAAFAGISLINLGKDVIDTTAKFQRFEAVLTNTLGSNSAAKIAMRDLEAFAAKTPFSVDQLTSSFVKLANQGFIPTQDELRKLGDLSASTGKEFDQLTEAIIDAQTGEFERLKEFGIRASKQGDQVKFTFKGVETQTKFTSSAIRDYILSLGDAEGVSGSMAAISETLGGQISNLGDSWTTFLKVVGDGNKGALSGVTKLLSTLLTQATDLLKTNRQVQEEVTVDAQSDALKEVQELAKVTDDLEASAFKIIDTLNLQKEALVDQSRALSVNKEEELEQIEVLNRKALVIDAQILAINDYVKAQVTKNQADEEQKKKLEAQLGIIPKIQEALKKIEEQKKRSFSVEEIGAFNREIKDLQEQLELLNSTGFESGFLKNLNKNQAAGKPTDLGLPQETAPANIFGTDLEAPDVNTDKVLESLLELDGAKDALDKNDEVRTASQIARQEARIKKQQEETAAALEFGNVIGESIGQAISGQKSFSQAMKQLTGDLIKMFLQRALAGIISAAATSGGPPPVAIALAAAGVAAISAMFSKIGGVSSSAGGGASLPQAASRRSLSPAGSESRIDLAGKFRVDGRDLVLALENNSIFNKRVG